MSSPPPTSPSSSAFPASPSARLPLSASIFTELKTSLALALPLMAAEVGYVFSNFTATAMVAHLGKEELAANALVWGIYVASLLFFIGVLTAVSIMVAQSFGACDDRAISRSFKQGIIMAFIFALPMMMIMWFSPIILVWTGQEPAVVCLARPFFNSLIWSILPLNIIIVINQFLMGINKTRLVLFMSILAVPIEIFFYYLFLFGKFGLPKFGLAGIGYALLVSYVVIATFFIYYLHVSPRLRAYHLFRSWWQFDRKFLFEMIRIGVPLGFVYCIEVALFAVVAIMMGVLGTTTLAAYQISYQYLMIGLSVLFGLTQCATIRVGNEAGRNHRAALKLATLVNMGIGFCIMLFISTIYIEFPMLAIGLDVNIHASALQPMIKEAKRFLAIVGILLFSDCFRIISLGALRGLKDTKFPLVGSIAGFWCAAFPIAYFLAFKLKWGGVGIWWGLLIGLTIAGIILFMRFSYLVKHVDLEKLLTKG